MKKQLPRRTKNWLSANEKIEAHEAEKKLFARKSLLLEAGLDSEEAEAAIEKFAEASDEMFEEVVSLISAKKKGALPPWLKKDKDDEDEDEGKKKAKKKAEVEAEEAEEADEAEAEETDEAEVEAEAEILESVEEEVEVALADAGDDSTEELRASASEWLETNVLRSTATLNK